VSLDLSSSDFRSLSQHAGVDPDAFTSLYNQLLSSNLGVDNEGSQDPWSSFVSLISALDGDNEVSSGHEVHDNAMDPWSSFINSIKEVPHSQNPDHNSNQYSYGYEDQKERITISEYLPEATSSYHHNAGHVLHLSNSNPIKDGKEIVINRHRLGQLEALGLNRDAVLDRYEKEKNNPEHFKDGKFHQGKFTRNLLNEQGYEGQVLNSVDRFCC